ncbi:TIGR01440 family protein [Thermoflavimicrobium daqui]|jgi:uncharacterized protein (TIGR01440 family)|uniref:UPF0340 protein DL897_11555 n=1 Tax=Thermoflavimicrobium daqui TaxID=2137476 RepID=A0A364K3E2_9BACL|nr:TIGR01440 family protein [Thermoflavimicrobium daqui]RAL23324.1 TIGR01440 family protein [Thermoflavimicrobium daqui]
MNSEELTHEIYTVIHDLIQAMPLNNRHLLVFGVSTSEVAGQRIGSAGSDEIAQALFHGIKQAQTKFGFQIAFQCCEHLNRAVVVERKTAEYFGYTEVAAIPVPHAGGAMASYAYKHLEQSVLVEEVHADAGIDIGDTLIGMHLKPVAVPVRPSIRQVGAAHVTMAKTRPKLIGGARAVYILEK